MKLLILADPSSPHTIKWVRGLAQKNLDIYIIGLSEYNKNNYENLSNVKVGSINLSEKIFSSNNFASKSIYLKALFKIKYIIKTFKPDILHAHYATSYGLLGALLGFKPYIISVWGSDIYDFPNESFIKKNILKFNLQKADYICSTSKAMSLETNKYTTKNINIVAFGIDTNKFIPKKKKLNIFNSDDIVIGTVKTLEDKYGIEYLIRSFHQVKKDLPEKKIKMLIVGGGSQKDYLTALTKKLGIEADTVFTGKINYDDIVDYYNELDIYLALSINESFGVAVIEASACNKPVIVSNAGGLPEVVEHGVTGYIVNKKDYLEASKYLKELIIDQELRNKIGINGRDFVKANYDFNINLEQMISIYNQAIKK